MALSLFNAASIWAYMKEYDKALEQHQRALSMRVRIYGERHPEVAGSLNNIRGLALPRGRLR